MLRVADPRTGDLLLEYREWLDVLPLAPGSLVPKWWPGTVEGRTLTDHQRQGDFEANLEILVSQSTNSSRIPDGEDSPGITVLRVLIYMRYHLLQQSVFEPDT